MHTNAVSQNSQSCDSVKRFVSNFVINSQEKDWNIVEDNADELQNCQCEMAPVLYHIYRMKMLLPNSHALQGISPNDFVSSQKLKMNEQVNILRRCEVGVYLPLINSMIRQNFDTEIAGVGIELKKKLESKK